MPHDSELISNALLRIEDFFAKSPNHNREDYKLTTISIDAYKDAGKVVAFLTSNAKPADVLILTVIGGQVTPRNTTFKPQVNPYKSPIQPITPQKPTTCPYHPYRPSLSKTSTRHHKEVR